MSIQRPKSLSIAAPFALALCVACSSNDDHPPVLPNPTSHAGGRTSKPGPGHGISGPTGTGTGGTGGRSNDDGGVPNDTGGYTSTGGRTSAGGDTNTGGTGTGGRTSSGFPPLDALDKNAVYLLGTLVEGLCGADALLDLRKPNTGAVGFECQTDHYISPIIDPRTGDIVYLWTDHDTQRLLVFVRDGSADIDFSDYPEHPTENDREIHTQCANDERIAGLWGDPDGGEIVYACDKTGDCDQGTCRYYRESGDVYEVPPNYALVALGLDATALLADAKNQQELVVNAKGAIIETQRINPEVTMRAHEGGFWYIKNSSSGDVQTSERWNIALDGTVASDGVYPRPVASFTYVNGYALDSSGRQYIFVSSIDDALIDLVYRAEVGADEGEIVHDETKSFVKIHGGRFITGP